MIGFFLRHLLISCFDLGHNIFFQRLASPEKLNHAGDCHMPSAQVLRRKLHTLFWRRLLDLSSNLVVLLSTLLILEYELDVLLGFGVKHNVHLFIFQRLLVLKLEIFIFIWHWGLLHVFLESVESDHGFRKDVLTSGTQVLNQFLLLLGWAMKHQVFKVNSVVILEFLYVC